MEWMLLRWQSDKIGEQLKVLLILMLASVENISL
jgi:hypothetical protein